MAQLCADTLPMRSRSDLIPCRRASSGCRVEYGALVRLYAHTSANESRKASVSIQLHSRVPSSHTTLKILLRGRAGQDLPVAGVPRRSGVPEPTRLYFTSIIGLFSCLFLMSIKPGMSPERGCCECIQYSDTGNLVSGLVST
jgi:hypothetical protein